MTKQINALLYAVSEENEQHSYYVTLAIYISSYFNNIGVNVF